MLLPRIRVVDLETTGSRPPAHGVCEVGWQDVVLSSGGRWEVSDERGAVLVNPGRPIPPATMAVHHIVDADVADAGRWREVAPRVLRPEGGVLALAAYRAAFEQLFCVPELAGGAKWTCNGSVYDSTSGDQISFNSVERLTVKYGSGNDQFQAFNAVVATDGGAGTDEFDGTFDNSSADISFALNPTAGATSTFIGQGSTIKNIESVAIVTGSSNDSLTGGALADQLVGGMGNDVIDGGAGNDILDGGDGIDTLSYATAGAGVTVSLANQGNYVDAIGAGTDLYAGFENLTGSRFADKLTGDGAANIIDGGLGADKMTGGSGSDTYYVDNAGDNVIESGGSGTGNDEVRTTLASYTLTKNVEKLTGLLATGQTLTGNTANNIITGGGGDDTIDGGVAAIR